MSTPLTIYLPACLSTSHEDFASYYDLWQLVYQVYQQAELAELQTPRDDDSSASEVGHVAKRRKTSRTGAEQAIEAFTNVMQSMVPLREKLLPTTDEDFFNDVMLDEDQKKKVLAEAPLSSKGPSLAFLCAYPEDVLEECGLTSLQIRAWKLLASKIL